MADDRGTAGLDHRRAPRRRGHQLLEAVFDAVLAELVATGYAALTVEAVAARARIGKATIYRRWPGKRDLVAAAVHAALPELAEPADTGSLRADLLAHFAAVAHHLNGPEGLALRGLLGGVLGDSEGAAELYSALHRGRSSAHVRLIAQRAATRGELTSDSVEQLTERQLEAGAAILRHHFLWEGRLDDALGREIVDEVVLPLLGAPVVRLTS